jgi:hypothetical protein
MAASFDPGPSSVAYGRLRLSRLALDLRSIFPSNPRYGPLTASPRAFATSQKVEVDAFPCPARLTLFDDQSHDLLLVRVGGPKNTYSQSGSISGCKARASGLLLLLSSAAPTCLRKIPTHDAPGRFASRSTMLEGMLGDPVKIPKHEEAIVLLELLHACGKSTSMQFSLGFLHARGAENSQA